MDQVNRSVEKMGTRHKHHAGADDDQPQRSAELIAHRQSKEEHGHHQRHGDGPNDDHAHRESDITVECLSKTRHGDGPPSLGPPSQSRQQLCTRRTKTNLIRINVDPQPATRRAQAFL